MDVRIALLVIVTTFVVNLIGYSEAVWGQVACRGDGRCAKVVRVYTHVPIAHNCLAYCRNTYRQICRSSYFDPNDRKCYVLQERCIDAELKYKNKGYVYFFRLHRGESCPSGMTKYSTPLSKYSAAFCSSPGVRCPGPDMYGAKPWRNQNRKFCTKKCSEILTCLMFDWKPNEGVNVTDTEALGTCYHKVSKCSDEELVNDENVYNFARQYYQGQDCTEARSKPGVE